MKKILGAAAAAALLSAPLPALACATCGCSLDTEDATGFSDKEGWMVGILYTNIDQSQLRRGTNSISQTQAAAINQGNQEIERDTNNNYTTFSATYTPAPEWRINAQLPYIDRIHSTYGQAADPSAINPGQVTSASFQQIGDAKIIGSYQGLLDDHRLGLQLGVKLPTGNYGGMNTATNAIVGHPINFNSGPNAGTPMDTSLQPGNGSTDLIVGGYYSRPISQDFDAYGNAQLEMSVNQLLSGANEDYRPGNLDTFSLGLRYEHYSSVVPQFQVNLTHKSADQGALADQTDTAGTVIYASPGVSVQVSEGVSLFGFIQVPVDSWLAGYQLFPRWTGSIGTTYAF
jgi:hypothetical protein